MQSKPKVLIVGGAGYLGSILSDKMSKNHDVFYYDKCIYGNEEIEKILYTCHKMVELGMKDFDIIVWSLTPDCDEFYEYFGEYVPKILELYKRCLSIGNRFYNLSTWELSYNQKLDDSIRLRFFKRLESEQKVKNIRIPSLYGPSPRMRWDTEINELIFHAIVQNEINLDKGCFDLFPVCSVVDAADYLIEIMKKSLNDLNFVENFHSNIINLVTASNIIVNSLNSKIKINCSENEESPEEVKVESERIVNGKSIKDNVEFIMKQLEKNMLQDFMSDRHNNRTTIVSAYNSIKFLENIKKCH